MARTKAARRSATKRPTRKTAGKRRAGKRPITRRASKRATPKRRARRAAAKPKKAKSAVPRPTTKPFGRPPKGGAGTRQKAARLDRVRRTLEETVPTPPSSLNMKRRGSAARTGRAELADSRAEHKGMASGITGGDVDVDVENAYFSGDEAPGGDNPTPDQEVVDDIGKALGVEYADNEELKSSDKVVERDKHRWELDPASSEDYKERK